MTLPDADRLLEPMAALEARRRARAAAAVRATVQRGAHDLPRRQVREREPARGGAIDDELERGGTDQKIA